MGSLVPCLKEIHVGEGEELITTCSRSRHGGTPELGGFSSFFSSLPPSSFSFSFSLSFSVFLFSHGEEFCLSSVLRSNYNINSLYQQGLP